MASEEPVQQKKKPQETFKVHSMVREIATRNHRMKAATHHRFVQRFGGGQITVRRARAATVTKAVLLRHLKELKKAEAEGKVVVKTMTGAVVNLETFDVTPPVDTASPPPNKPLDSAAKDKTFEYGVGEKRPLFGGEGGVPGGPPPALNVRQPLMNTDTPIKTAGDPAKARAEVAAVVIGAGTPDVKDTGKGASTKPTTGDDEGEEEMEDLLGDLDDDVDTKPESTAPVGGDTEPASKRGRSKKDKDK
jgi:hypothetical protein